MSTLRTTPLHASPGMHVNVPCQNCHRQIEFFLRGGVNRLECRHCHQTTDIDVVHVGDSWEARGMGASQ